MRKMIFSSLAVIVGMALLVPSAFAQGGILFGRVTDVETGEPVAGAVVRLDGHSPLGNAEPDDPRDETTSESGEYTLLGLPSGTWNITVEAEGYQAAPGTVTVRFGRNARGEHRAGGHPPSADGRDGSGGDRGHEPGGAERVPRRHPGRAGRARRGA